MADIAAIFHWSKAELESLSICELVEWRARAVDRWNTMHGNPESGA
ncbi:GpE family phage tail protein [Novosphingobium sp. SL115]|nr:GpE family phage tail protein [Novosphingobium sp. SL115]MCY1672130.1 GpE family phage tail protein [Novosphingobium sp. SL115]